MSVGKLFHILTTRYENDLCPLVVLKEGCLAQPQLFSFYQMPQVQHQ